MRKDEIIFSPLGGGQRVGASCYYLCFRNHHILLDAGIDSNKRTPVWSHLLGYHHLTSMNQIEQIYISHAHMDHIGSLFGMMSQCTQASVYMTAITKSLAELQIYDRIYFNSLQNDEKKRMAAQNCFDRITVISYIRTMNFHDYRVTFYPAGHIPGAMMTLLELPRYSILYLCTRNNTRDVLIPTGAELPFDSEVKKYLLPTSKDSVYTSQVIFPIQSQNIDGTFRMIAKSIASFNSRYPAETQVAVQVHMNPSKVITMEAWICLEDETIKTDLVQTKIIIENTLTPEQRKIRTVIAPNGSKINPKEVISSLIKNCENFEQQTTAQKHKEIAEKIRMDVNSLCSACNRKEFAPVILQALRTCKSEEAKMRLFIVSRKIMSDWTEKEKKEIAKICLNQLGGVLNGLTTFSRRKTSSNIQAIYTLSVCGTPEQISKLEKIHGMSEYLHPCLYAHGHSKTCISWLIEQFEDAARTSYQGEQRNLPDTAYFLGYALYDNESAGVTPHEVKQVIKKLLNVIKNADLEINSLISCILALSWICAVHNQARWQISQKLIKEVKNTIANLDDTYEPRIQKAKNVVSKLLEGQTLSPEEEALLLEPIKNFV